MKIFTQTDYKKLAEQKETLLYQCGNESIPEAVRKHFEGVINFIDNFQDEAAIMLGNAAVFGSRTEQARIKVLLADFKADKDMIHISHTVERHFCEQHDSEVEDIVESLRELGYGYEVHAKGLENVWEQFKSGSVNVHQLEDYLENMEHFLQTKDKEVEENQKYTY